MSLVEQYGTPLSLPICRKFPTTLTGLKLVSEGDGKKQYEGNTTIYCTKSSHFEYIIV
jgi:hypothetical protein